MVKSRKQKKSRLSGNQTQTKEIKWESHERYKDKQNRSKIKWDKVKTKWDLIGMEPDWKKYIEK